MENSNVVELQHMGTPFLEEINIEEMLVVTFPLGGGLFMSFDLRDWYKRNKPPEQAPFMIVTKSGRILIPSMNIY